MLSPSQWHPYPGINLWSLSLAWFLQAYDLNPVSQVLRRRVAQLLVNGHVMPICLAWQSLDLELEPHRQQAVAKINLMVISCPVDSLHTTASPKCRDATCYLLHGSELHVLSLQCALPSKLMQDGDSMHHPYPMLDENGRTAATIIVSIQGTGALRRRVAKLS